MQDNNMVKYVKICFSYTGPILNLHTSCILDLEKTLAVSGFVITNGIVSLRSKSVTESNIVCREEVKTQSRCSFLVMADSI